jgi:hypothetical protein
MSDTIAQLGLAVDSSQAKAASVDLDKLAQSSKSAAAATDVLGGAATRAASAEARMGSAAAGATVARTAMTATQRLAVSATEAEVAALAHHERQLGLNRIQVLEFGHVFKSVVDQLIAGQNPIRALALEGGRLQTAFTFNNTFLGTLRAIAPILGPIIAIVGGLAVGFKAVTDRMNEGKGKAVDFGHVIEATFQVAWKAFSEQFGKAPGWVSAAWDKIGQIFGDGVNNVIRYFATLGAAVDILMKEIPDYFAIGFQHAVNLSVVPLNYLIDQLKKVLGLVAMLPGVGPSMAMAIATVGHIQPPELGGANATADLSRQEALYRDRARKINSTDYLAQIRTQALKDAAGKKKTAESPYEKAIQSAKDATAALNAQAAALGKTAEQAAYLEEKTKLLNEAEQKGVNLSPSQLKNIDNLARAYAAAKANLEALTQLYDLGKSTTEDFFSTLKSGLMSGTSLWQSLGDAASKALDDIANKALQMAADGVWNSIFGAMSGSTGSASGGLLSSLLGLFGGSSGGTPGLGSAAWGGQGFANGTLSAPGGLALVGEHGPELVNLPAGSGVSTASQTAAMLGAAANGAANSNSVNHYHIDARGAQLGVGTEIANAIDRFSRLQLPGRVAQISASPSRVG